MDKIKQGPDEESAPKFVIQFLLSVPRLPSIVIQLGSHISDAGWIREPSNPRDRQSTTSKTRMFQAACTSPTLDYPTPRQKVTCNNFRTPRMVCTSTDNNPPTICNFSFSHFFKWIPKILTNIRCSVKRKSSLLFPAIANLQFKHFLCSKICIGFHYASLNFHIFSNGVINTHKYKVFCKKEETITTPCYS